MLTSKVLCDRISSYAVEICGFDFVGFVPGPASTQTGYSEFQYPFNYSATQMNIDPNANGYIVGWELIPSTSGAPGPVAGAGLPGFVMVAAGLLAWTRRRNVFQNLFQNLAAA